MDWEVGRGVRRPLLQSAYQRGDGIDGRGTTHDTAHMVYMMTGSAIHAKAPCSGCSRRRGRSPLFIASAHPSDFMSSPRFHPSIISSRDTRLTTGRSNRPSHPRRTGLGYYTPNKKVPPCSFSKPSSVTARPTPHRAYYSS